MEVSEIIEAVDIVDFISQYVDLELKGGEYWGISPFTFPPENTPSFSVRRETGKFYDFSSGKGGNIISFVTELLNISVPEAIETIKKFAGITEDVSMRHRLEATKIAKKYRISTKSEKVCDASVLPSDYMDRYEFNKEKLKVWNDEGIDYEVMRQYGVMYDAYSDRIVYPIKNVNGDIINVSGRTLDPDYKAHGLRKYTYFKSIGAVPTIYGLSDNIEYIRNAGEIILFEGAKSVMLAASWGILNTGAMLTSHISQKQFEILLRLGVNVVVAFDSDVDVSKDENVKRLRRYLPCFWVKNIKGILPEKYSPVDKGFDTFIYLYENKVRL